MSALAPITHKGVLALSSSAEFREKCLKALQYLAKLFAATGAGGAFSKALAKHVSSCRRLVTFLRCVKYSANFEEAAETTAEPLRGLLYAEATLNVTVDSMQDVVTLEKLGLVRLPRWLSGFEKLAEVLDAVLAAVGVAVGVLRLQAASAAKQLPHKLQLIGYVGDLLKNVHAAHPSIGPGETLAALGGLAAASLSARKIRLKVAPPPPPSISKEVPPPVANGQAEARKER